MGRKITTVTVNPCIDRTLSIERMVPERKLEAEDIRRDPGGGGLNVARAVRRLGGDAFALWSCGGATGADLARLLDREEIAHDPVAIGGSTRENLIVEERPTGLQYRIGTAGPELSQRELDGWRERMVEAARSSGYLVLSGSLPPGATPDWYRDTIRAIRNETRVVVDNKQDHLQAAVDAGVFLLKPNVHELAELLGEECDGVENAAAAARKLVERGGAHMVLVSMGRAGAVLVTEADARAFTSPQVRIRSKVGAGDSMVGAFVWALSEGRSAAEAARFGVAAGAAAVQTEGTQLCRGDETRRLVERVRDYTP